MSTRVAADRNHASTFSAGLLLVVAFVPSVVTSVFLGGQAWYSFTDPVQNSYIWGTACLVLLAAPFVATPVAVLWTRRRGASSANSLFIGAGVAFSAICGGLALAMFAAAFGGM